MNLPAVKNRRARGVRVWGGSERQPHRPTSKKDARWHFLGQLRYLAGNSSPLSYFCDEVLAGLDTVFANKISTLAIAGRRADTGPLFKKINLSGQTGGWRLNSLVTQGDEVRAVDPVNPARSRV